MSSSPQSFPVEGKSIRPRSGLWRRWQEIRLIGQDPILGLGLLLVGVFVIAYTPLRTIQRRDSSLVQLDADGITEGNEQGTQHMLWAQITHLIKADTCVWRCPFRPLLHLVWKPKTRAWWLAPAPVGTRPYAGA